MLDDAPMRSLAAQLAAMQRQLRGLPAASRAAMDAEAKTIGDRIARKIDAAAGSVPRPARTFAVALRRGGIQVKPGRGELAIVVGGNRASGIGRLTMADLVRGAEFGGRGRVTRYTQRRRRGHTTVRRRVTRQFGRAAVDGRFVYPTWQAEAPAAVEAWAAAVEATIVDYWEQVARA